MTKDLTSLNRQRGERKPARRAGLQLLLAAALVAGGAQAQEQGDLILVSLRPSASAANACVRLGDLADVTGGTAEQRRRLVQLDIADVQSQQQSTYITKDQIAF